MNNKFEYFLNAIHYNLYLEEVWTNMLFFKFNQKTLTTMLPLSLFALNSCVIIDTKPLGYTVKNCTNDTLLIDLYEADTLSDEIYWDTNPVDVPPDDTTTVCINGKMVNIYNFFRVMPHSRSKGFYPLKGDTCYVHTMKWQIVTHCSWDEIRSKKLYNSTIVTKKEFDGNRIYEYKNEKCGSDD